MLEPLNLKYFPALISLFFTANLKKMFHAASQFTRTVRKQLYTLVTLYQFTMFNWEASNLVQVKRHCINTL